MKSISRVTRVIPRGPSSQVDKKQMVIGAEGWEAIGPINTLTPRPGDLTPELLMKRPVY